MIEKFLFVSDGIIALMADGDEVPEDSRNHVALTVTEYGAELRCSNAIVNLPAAVLEHPEEADGTTIYFYESDPYSLVASYHGSIMINRDEILKVKGAWEFSQAP